MTIPVEVYKRYIDTIGNDDTSVPELNRGFLHRYIDMCYQQQVSVVIDLDYHDLDGILLIRGFGNHEEMSGFERTMDLAIFRDYSHPCYPWGQDKLESVREPLFKLFDTPFGEDGIEVLAGIYKGEPLENCRNANMLNSRICRFKSSEGMSRYAATVASLNTKRRYKVRQMEPELESVKVCKASAEMLPFIHHDLSKRYSGFELEYAYIQSIWSVAVGATCFYQGDTPLANDVPRAFFYTRDVGTFQGKEPEVEALFQTLVISDPHNAFGSLALVAAMKHYSEDPSVDIINPTCRVVTDEYSIDIYKRFITNEDRPLPLFWW